jgi:hypothetical protein
LVSENLSKAFAFFSSSAMLLNFGLPAGPQPAPASKKADLARNVWAKKPAISTQLSAGVTALPPSIDYFE